MDGGTGRKTIVEHTVIREGTILHGITLHCVVFHWHPPEDIQ